MNTKQPQMGNNVPIEKIQLSVLRRINRELRVALRKAQKENSKLKEEREIDATTGLLNKRGFIRHVSHYFRDGSKQKGRRAARTEKDIPACLVLIDLDGMKQINDAHGYAKGDEVIFFLAQCLQWYFRKGIDVIARLHQDNGDEFLVFLPEVDQKVANCLLGERRKSFEHDTKRKFPELRADLSFSYGISCDLSSVESMIAEADRKMHADKAKRKVIR